MRSHERRRRQARRLADRHGWLLALSVHALGITACATPPRPVEREALLGCWYFEQGGAAAELRLPWGVRLADEPVEGWPAIQELDGVRGAETLTPAGPRDFPIGYWRPTAEGDSIEMGYPAGGGILVRAAVPYEDAEERMLHGTIRSVGDAVEPGGQGPAPQPRDVRLIRARCP